MTEGRKGQEIVATLVTAFHQETMRVTKECEEAREVKGFYSGFQYGFSQGAQSARNEILAALGLPVKDKTLTALECRADYERKESAHD